MPPREMAASSPARPPVANARILNSRRLNIGESECSSIHAERGEEHEPRDERDDHLRRRPAHRVTAVRLDPVHDRREHRRKSYGEGDVAPPVDARLHPASVVFQALVRPDRADDADRNRDPEHQAPVDDREQTAGDESDERAGDRRDLVDADREAALFDRERVGDDRARVREQHRAADTLQRAATAPATTRRRRRASGRAPR